MFVSNRHFLNVKLEKEEEEEKSEVKEKSRLDPPDFYFLNREILYDPASIKAVRMSTADILNRHKTYNISNFYKDFDESETYYNISDFCEDAHSYGDSPSSSSSSSSSSLSTTTHFSFPSSNHT